MLKYFSLNQSGGLIAIPTATLLKISPQGKGLLL